MCNMHNKYRKEVKKYIFLWDKGFITSHLFFIEARAKHEKRPFLLIFSQKRPGSMASLAKKKRAPQQSENPLNRN